MHTKTQWKDAGPLRLRVLAGNFAPLNFRQSNAGGDQSLLISGARREEWHAGSGIHLTRRLHDSWFIVRRGMLHVHTPTDEGAPESSPQEVREGQCLAIPRNAPHRLSVPGPAHADIYLLHGSGGACEAWWDYLGHRRIEVLPCRRQEELLLALEALLRHHQSPWPADRWTGGLYFQVALSLLAVDATTPPISPDPDGLPAQAPDDPAFWCHDLITREFLHLQDFAEIAARLGFHPDYLARRYRQQFRETPAQTLRRLKLDHACRLLREENLTLEALAREIGFADAFSFSKAFKRHTGLSPSQWRTVAAP